MGDQKLTYMDIPESRWSQEVFGKDMAHDRTALQIADEVERRLPVRFEARSYTYEEVRKIVLFAAGVGLRYEEQPAPLPYKVKFAAEVIMEESYYQATENPTAILEGEQ